LRSFSYMVRIGPYPEGATMMSARLETMFAMNPDFKKAYLNGESWALKQADSIRGIDGQSNRRHPERAHQENGLERRNWCGACSDPEGCVTCDLDEPSGSVYQNMKPYIGKDRRR
jgi:hypothetical protein